MHYLLPYDTVHSTLFPSFMVMCWEICNQVDKTTKAPKKNARVSRTICILAIVKEHLIMNQRWKMEYQI